MINTYSPCNDFHIASILSAGDEFIGKRNVKVMTVAGKMYKIVECKYKLSYAPVYMAYSNCYSLRCHTKSLNESLDKEDFHALNEYIYINAQTLHLYKFKDHHIRFFVNQQLNKPKVKSLEERISVK
jgi:hypothetical protein